MEDVYTHIVDAASKVFITDSLSTNLPFIWYDFTKKVDERRKVEVLKEKFIPFVEHACTTPRLLKMTYDEATSELVITYDNRIDEETPAIPRFTNEMHFQGGLVYLLAGNDRIPIRILPAGRYLARYYGFEYGITKFSLTLIEQELPIYNYTSEFEKAVTDNMLLTKVAAVAVDAFRDNLSLAGERWFAKDYQRKTVPGSLGLEGDFANCKVLREDNYVFIVKHDWEPTKGVGGVIMHEYWTESRGISIICHHRKPTPLIIPNDVADISRPYQIGTLFDRQCNVVGTFITVK